MSSQLRAAVPLLPIAALVMLLGSTAQGQTDLVHARRPPRVRPP
jgi:hypothetical protein